MRLGYRAAALRLSCVVIGGLLIGLSLSFDATLGGNPGFGRGEFALLIAGLAYLAAASLPRPWIARVILVTASFVLSLALAEGILRGFFAPSLSTTYRLHPRYIHELIPGAEFYYQHDQANGGERILVRVNQDGYRGIDLAQPRSGIRIAVFGDSFVAAQYTKLEASFPHQLGRVLERDLGRPVEVVTVGVAAYGPDQSLLRLRDELAQLDPDLVVFTVFSGNDFGDLVRNRLFELSETGGLVPLSPRISDLIQRKFTRASTGPMLLRAVRKIGSARKLRARAASQTRSRDRSIRLMEGWLAECRREYAAAIDGREPVVTSLFYDHYDADLAFEPRSPSARYKVDLMEAVLASAHDEATRAGVPFLLVVVPEPLDLISDYDSGVVDRDKHPEYRPENLTRALAQIAERRSIPAVDLFPVFIDSNPATLYFRAGNNHWNDTGQALAAEFVGARVLMEAWLKPAH